MGIISEVEHTRDVIDYFVEKFDHQKIYGTFNHQPHIISLSWYYNTIVEQGLTDEDLANIALDRVYNLFAPDSNTSLRCWWSFDRDEINFTIKEKMVPAGDMFRYERLNNARHYFE